MGRFFPGMPRPWLSLCRSFASLFQHREHLKGHSRPLAARQVAAKQVLTENPFRSRALTIPFNESWLYPGYLARCEPASTIEDFALEKDNGIQESPLVDVGGKLLKLLFAHRWKKEASGVVAQRFHGSFLVLIQARL